LLPDERAVAGRAALDAESARRARLHGHDHIARLCDEGARIVREAYGREVERRLPADDLERLTRDGRAPRVRRVVREARPSGEPAAARRRGSAREEVID